MSEEKWFDYYYGNQAEKYSFYRIPKILFTDKIFKKISCEAKVLYGLLLDRMSLSVKNQWLDEKQRVYIIFTIEEIIETVGCSRQKAVRLLQELDHQKGIGLIEKKRIGLGKANVIYVKNFMHTPRKRKEEQPLENREDFQKYENHTSRGIKNGIQEVPKSDDNKTNKSNTDYSDINILSINQNSSAENEEIDEIKAVTDVIYGNIEYSILCQRYEQKKVDEIVSILQEVLLSTENRTVIGGRSIPSALLKSQLLKLNFMHIQYVFYCMEKNTTKVRNIKQYLLTALYNAPMTLDHFYQQEVNHDLYGMTST